MRGGRAHTLENVRLDNIAETCNRRTEGRTEWKSTAAQYKGYDGFFEQSGGEEGKEEHSGKIKKEKPGGGATSLLLPAHPSLRAKYQHGGVRPS